MIEQLHSYLKKQDLSSVGEIQPPFESDADVGAMLSYARVRYMQHLSQSGILESSENDFLTPSEIFKGTIVDFRKQAVRYRSVMWICGTGDRQSKFDSTFYGLPKYEESFIYRLGQYKDAVLGIEGDIQESASRLIPKLNHIRTESAQELLLQPAPIALARDRLSHAIGRIDDLSQSPTITDRGMHDLRILIRVMRDIYKASDARLQIKDNIFVKWLDMAQNACNEWRNMVFRGEVASLPAEHNEGTSKLVVVNGLPDEARYQLPQDIARASQDIVIIMRKVFTPIAIGEVV